MVVCWFELIIGIAINILDDKEWVHNNLENSWRSQTILITFILLTSFTHKSIIITIKLECVTRFKNITIGHFIGHQTVDSRVPELAFVLNFKNG